MSNNANNSVVAVYETHENAEDAIKKLTEASILIKNIGVIGRGYHHSEKVIGFYNNGDRIEFWGKYGAFWGGMWGLFAGGLLLTIPVVGPVVLLGQAATLGLVVVESAILGGGLSALGASLYGIGLPENTILKYEDNIKEKGILVMVHGTAEEVEKARAILETSNVQSIDVHVLNDAKGIDKFEISQMKNAS
jgi:hypothetical protein